MNVKEMYPSRTLSGAEVQSPIQATIASIKMETLGRGADANQKPILSFHGNVKPMVLNKTNAKILAKHFGNDSANWIGKTVEIYFDPNVPFGDEIVGGLRLRIPAQSNDSGFTFWTREQATIEVNKVGLTWADVVAHLKQAGMSGYSPTRDTAMVQALIQSKAGAEEPFEDDVPPPPVDGEIPF